MAQAPQAPNVGVQRTAMKKLEFLVGEWSGEATVLRGPGQFAEMAQTESAVQTGRTCADDRRCWLSEGRREDLASSPRI